MLDRVAESVLPQSWSNKEDEAIKATPSVLQMKRRTQMLDMKPAGKHPVSISVRKVSLSSGGPKIQKSISIVSLAADDNSTKSLQDLSHRLETVQDTSVNSFWAQLRSLGLNVESISRNPIDESVKMYRGSTEESTQRISWFAHLNIMAEYVYTAFSKIIQITTTAVL
jgi:hypothetical protein